MRLFLFILFFIMLTLCTIDSQAVSITIVASGAEYYDRPRINDLGEIVWSQRIDGTNQIWSNVIGQVSIGPLDRDPDINNNGEIIWRYGDGGSGPNGIKSNLRGIIYKSNV